MPTYRITITDAPSYNDARTGLYFRPDESGRGVAMADDEQVNAYLGDERFLCEIAPDPQAPKSITRSMDTGRQE